MTKITLITNIPAPYREKIHEHISEYFHKNYSVVYCAERESNREWKFQYGNYSKCILNTVNKDGVHNNFKIFKILNDINPDVLIIMGFYPTMIYAYLWSVIKGKSLVVFTDGTYNSESHLSWIHKVVRRLVFKKAKAFIGPSKGAAELYHSYGISKSKFFRTYLSVNNKLFFKTSLNDKKFDLMFSGQFIDLKMPFFFIEIAKQVKEQNGECKVLLLGNGPLKNDILLLLDKYHIDYSYPGFIRQDELPKYYTQAKIFLFPTKNDTWGIVANEAMASGVPVITCKEAGVAYDLVRHNENGFVLPLVTAEWVDTIIRVLNNPSQYERLSKNALNDVQGYNFKNAANGIIDGINYVSS